MSDIGHNNPPEVLQLAVDVIADISGKMADVPVVETEEDARLIKMEIDRAKACIKDLESELDGKVRPLNTVVEGIRVLYRGPRRMLGDLLDEMLARTQVFVRAEQQRRAKLALEAAMEANAAKQRAKEAERIERERLDDAAKGEVGVNVAEVIADADEAFEAYSKARREEEIARSNMHVKIGGGFSRAIGMRKTETLQVIKVHEAIVEIGLTEDIREAVLKSARAFRKLHGRLPNGIKSTVEEHL